MPFYSLCMRLEHICSKELYFVVDEILKFSPELIIDNASSKKNSNKASFKLPLYFK